MPSRFLSKRKYGLDADLEIDPKEIGGGHEMIAILIPIQPSKSTRAAAANLAKESSL